MLELGPADFHRLVESDPGLVAYFLRRTIMRVVSNEQMLIRQLRRRNHDLEAALDNLYTTTHQLNHTEELVRTDELTGLHNRRYMVGQLTEFVRGANRGAGPVSLLLIDIDHFKKVNDVYVHAGGDQVLVAVARDASAQQRRTDQHGDAPRQQVDVRRVRRVAQHHHPLAVQRRQGGFVIAPLPQAHHVLAGLQVRLLLGVQVFASTLGGASSTRTESACGPRRPAAKSNSMRWPGNNSSTPLGSTLRPT